MWHFDRSISYVIRDTTFERASARDSPFWLLRPFNSADILLNFVQLGGLLMKVETIVGHGGAEPDLIADHVQMLGV